MDGFAPRIVATEKCGLLVDPVEADAKGPKVPPDRVLAAITTQPGMTYEELGSALGVSKDTADRYVKGLGDRVVVVPGTNRKSARVFPVSTAAPQSAASEAAALDRKVPPDQHRSAARTYIGAAEAAAVLGKEGQEQARGSASPPPDGAPCPDCGAGPFQVADLYERHWQQMHADIETRGREDAAATDSPSTVDEDLAESAKDDDAEVWVWDADATDDDGELDA
jgi:hypothetical protein